MFLETMEYLFLHVPLKPKYARRNIVWTNIGDSDHDDDDDDGGGGT